MVGYEFEARGIYTDPEWMEDTYKKKFGAEVKIIDFCQVGAYIEATMVVTPAVPGAKGPTDEAIRHILNNDPEIKKEWKIARD